MFNFKVLVSLTPSDLSFITMFGLVKNVQGKYYCPCDFCCRLGTGCCLWWCWGMFCSRPWILVLACSSLCQAVWNIFNTSKNDDLTILRVKKWQIAHLQNLLAGVRTSLVRLTSRNLCKILYLLWKFSIHIADVGHNLKIIKGEARYKLFFTPNKSFIILKSKNP